MTRPHRPAVLAALVILIAPVLSGHPGQEPPVSDDDRAHFKGRVDFVNVNATVTDASGRFVPGLKMDDFTVYEDDQRVQAASFSFERVPISLGIALDTSDSMTGDKIKAARGAIDRLLDEVADKKTEMFLYRFGDLPILAQGWTTDRRLIGRALERIAPSGSTAMYDTVAAAITLANTGHNQKKVLMVISDGRDTFSNISVRDLKDRIRESDVLVYAIGIDGASVNRPVLPRRPRRPRVPSPLPGLPGVRSPAASAQWLPGQDGTSVDVQALRELTDDNGGRTAVVRDSRSLVPVITGIADELGRQYYLGYTSPAKKDGQWHSIRVAVGNPDYHVRARRGYVAN